MSGFVQSLFAAVHKLLPDSSVTTLALGSNATLAPLPETRIFGVPGGGKSGTSFPAGTMRQGGPIVCVEPVSELYTPPSAPVQPVSVSPRRRRVAVTETVVYIENTGGIYD